MQPTYRINSLTSLFQLLRFVEGIYPRNAAIADDIGSTDYSSLLENVQRVAAGLAAAGIRRGDRIAVFANKDRRLLILLLACNAVGVVFVPINPHLKQAQVLHILTDCHPALLVSTSHRVAQLSLTSNQPDLRWQEMDALVEAEPAPGQVLDWARGAVDGDAAAILYTSGSTGLAKGVVVSQRNLVSGALSVADYLGLESQDVVLGVLPLSFDAGLSQLTTALAAGACYVVHEFLSAAQFRRAVQQHRPSVITAVPPLWHLITESGWSADGADSVRLVANTGGHMNKALLDRVLAIFPQARPVLMYGLTESFRSTWLPPEQLARHPDSMGFAVPNAQLLVVRPDGTECGPDEPGELVHRGSFVTLGYLGNPELNAQRFRPWPLPTDRWNQQELAVWSGDVVRRDVEGYLYFIGRTDEMLKVSGHRISPTEVETALLAMPGVLEAAVFGMPDERLGQTIVACVVLQAATGMEQLPALCRKQLPAYMQPASLVCMDALPRNGNGKIDRGVLRAQWLERSKPSLTAAVEAIA
ncbi:AMP-binding protein [Xanthomonas hydrangeae]|uniref:AMP-binding protein n=1 Tax=Xanthomonas hydrangeae TaxID=2775159 RepID=A0AAU0B4D5_9XANT|nr:AMP-binding protein [Xanthomonas hydrangeae]WOB47938.1 AMP-binding protein [Xanthomonas hydrangeae]